MTALSTKSSVTIKKSSDAAVKTVIKLYCIYNSDSGFFGDLRYMFRKWMQGEKCALCQLTHAVGLKKRAWKRFVAKYPVAIEVCYRDEIDKDMQAITQGDFPMVLAEIQETMRSSMARHLEVMGPAELDTFEGDVDQFEMGLRRALTRMSLKLKKMPA